MKINLDNKIFQAKSNSENGEVSSDTRFHYHQDGAIIWAEYQGGSILKGSLIGKIVNDEYLEFVYQHINDQDEMLTGKCKSYPEIIENEKILLKESWQWTCRDFSHGESVLIEQ